MNDLLLAATDSDVLLVLNTQVLSILLGVVIPILVGLVTNHTASSGLKAILNAGLSILAGLLNAAFQADGIITREAVLAAAMTWVVSIATYYGLYRPTGIAEAVQKKTAGFGIG